MYTHRLLDSDVLELFFTYRYRYTYTFIILDLARLFFFLGRALNIRIENCTSRYVDSLE